MSKAVDDAVCDFFSLLLNEPQPIRAVDSLTAERLATESRVTASHYAQSRTLANLESDERLSRQALEQLFARSPREDSNREENNREVQACLDTAPIRDACISERHDTNTTSVIDSEDKHAINLGHELKQQAELTVSSESQNILDTQAITETAIEPLASTQKLLDQLDEEFQVLFFKVGGLTLAVPLVSLGGIVNLDKLTRLMGRPAWYMGVQQYREAQLNVVDTCAWVMPEKYEPQLVNSVKYQYVVVLEDSAWGLGCETLIDTTTIKKSEINWRSHAGKRPWLAGVVKERMCGILNVEALVQMLGLGLGCQEQVPVN
ncbi:chemotaxis protein CheW [Shewanella sp. 125m-7]